MSIIGELDGLAGLEMSAVVFVRDYIQLQFDGPVFTALNLPVVTNNANSWSAHDPGYRDALCGQIGQIVRSTSISDGKAIEICFADSVVFRISLDPADCATAEAANYCDPNGGLWVW